MVTTGGGRFFQIAAAVFFLRRLPGGRQHDNTLRPPHRVPAASMA